MLRLIRNVAALFAVFGLLTACNPTPDSGDLSHHRAIRELALSYGAQSGLAWKTKSIMAILERHAGELDQVYNFNSLLMRHNVMPPVVSQQGKTYSIESEDTIRISDQEIRMARPARFVSVAPTWREYIYHLTYPEPTPPPEGLLPETPSEVEIWKEAASEGWLIGVDQATMIFEDALARLNRDFQGMILYHVLHIQNMISAPYTETTNLGITGNTQGLRLNDKVIKITRPSILNPQTNQWQPIVVEENK